MNSIFKTSTDREKNIVFNTKTLLIKFKSSSQQVIISDIHVDKLAVESTTVKKQKMMSSISSLSEDIK